MLLKNTMALIDGVFVKQDIRIGDGAILEMKDSLVPLDNGEICDFAGDYLTPGFVDVHIHAFMGMDVMAGEQAVRHMSRELKKVGVAAFCPTTMSASVADTLKALQGIAAVMEGPEADGAVVLGAHMEAPFLQGDKCGAQQEAFFLPPTMANYDMLTGTYGPCVRLITMAPELEGAMAFIAEARRKGITVSLGHTSADAETVHLAASVGATHVTHTFNAQTPLGHREPGVPGAALSDERLYAEVIADKIHLHPDILKIAYLCKGKSKLVLVSDAMEAAGMPGGTYALGGQQVFVKDGAARLASGVLAGSTLLMHQAVSNMASLGIDFADAAAMATLTPAESINEAAFGRIQPGAKLPLNRFNKQYKHIQVIN